MAESSAHSRNLKFVAVLYILFWILDMEQTGDNVTLYFVDFKINNEWLLPYLAFLFLLYFMWRFFLSKRVRFKHIIAENFNWKQGQELPNRLEKIFQYSKDNFIKEKKEVFLLGYFEQMDHFNPTFTQVMRSDPTSYNINVSPSEIQRMGGRQVRCCIKVTVKPMNTGGLKVRDINYIKTYDIDIPSRKLWKHEIITVTKSLILSESFADNLLPWLLSLFALFLTIWNLFE